MEAYKYLLAGWVGKVSAHCVGRRGRKGGGEKGRGGGGREGGGREGGGRGGRKEEIKDSNEKVILYAKVRHSQAVKASPLLLWVATHREDTIICSHCTCMAGLGETYNVAAVLFAVETYNRLNRDNSCTSQLCAWLPSTMQNVKYAPNAEIDFTAPSTKRRKVTWNQSFEQVSSLQKSPPTDKELSCFYEALSKTAKPALLSLHLKYSDSYIVDYSKLSTPLSSLFDEKCLELPYELLEKYEEAFYKIQVSTSQTRNIKTATQTQAVEDMVYL